MLKIKWKNLTKKGNLNKTEKVKKINKINKNWKKLTKSENFYKHGKILQNGERYQN